MWQSLKNIYHLCGAFLATVWYKFPSSELTIIGVTGTDGKTTTVNLIHHVLKTNDFNASMISSVGAFIGNRYQDVGFHVTNPPPWPLQKFLRESADSGKYLVLEVTSHGLDQYRVFGIKFQVGVITNVTHEHLDYHKTYEKYLETKSKLLNMAKVAVINRDDKSYALLSSKFLEKDKRVITYGIDSKSDINPKLFPFQTNLMGDFNRYNVLAAIGSCKAIGLKDEQIRKALKTFKPPLGRGEIVYSRDFTVMIDFAHTPNSFEQVLSELKKDVKGKLIHLFGSAGRRDASKRSVMGEISAKYSDIIILTSEDPRDESIDSIIADIVVGIKKSKFNMKNCFRINDRQNAINKAVQIADKGDFVLLTGKGHEKSMNYGQGEVSWSEHEAVKKAVNQRIKKKR